MTNNSLMRRGFYGFIYMVIDIIDNKKYIGQTIQTLEARLSQHLSNPPNKYFAKALQKHGKKKFIIKELSKTYNVYETNRLERYYIAKFRTYIRLYGTEFGYNVSKGGVQFVPSGESHPNYIIIKADDLERLIQCGFFKEEIARELNIHSSSINRKIKELWFFNYNVSNITQAREFFGAVAEWEKRRALITPTYRDIDKEYFESLIVKGLFTEEIAEELDIGEKTVNNKIDEYWGEEFDIHKLSEARQLFGGDEIFQKKYSEICRNKALGRKHSENTKKKISVSTSGSSNPGYVKINEKKLKNLIIQSCNTSAIAETLKIGRGSVNNKIEEFWGLKYGIYNLTQARKFFRENPNKM